MLTFAIDTLGCKVNTYESQSYLASLKASGFQEVKFNEQADIYIINTCAVTNTAAAKSRQRVNQAIKQNPHALICVVGCLIQIGDEYLNNDQDIDVLIGSSQKKMLVPLIQQALKTKERQIFKQDVFDHPLFEDLQVESFEHQTRAFLKIQDGCDQYCSYCIIPYARGKERSLAPQKVIQKAQTLSEKGHLEIVLSGIHTGRYGKEYQTDLEQLLQQLIMTSIKRLRISSIEINEVTDGIIQLIKPYPVLAKHLHIPLQAGSDKILKAMRRPYDKAFYLKRVRFIKQQIPDISISTDIIVGFPGESAEDFAETFNFVKEVGFSFIHVFPYSKRTGTLAAKLDQQLTNAIKKQRVHELMDLSKIMYTKYQSRFIGETLEVLFESKKDDYYYGHSSEYLPVKAKSFYDLRHKMYNVIIKETNEQELIGSVKEKIYETKSID